MKPDFVHAYRFLRAAARATPGSIRALTLWSARSVCFSNFGEDLLLTRMFRLPDGGFYVDVGANHPVGASNTFRLDLLGWSGVAIEPNPDLTRLFRRMRPNCRVVEAGVGEREGELEYIMFSVDQCNTFDPKLAQMARDRGVREIGRRTVGLRRLDSILAETVGDRRIDVMSIDVEGKEMEAFRSNDWSRWSPSVIIAEDHVEKPDGFMESEVARYLVDKGYACVSRVHFSSFFVRRDRMAELAW